jgi:predicted metal-dependent hydrolase
MQMVVVHLAVPVVGLECLTRRAKRVLEGLALQGKEPMVAAIIMLARITVAVVAAEVLEVSGKLLP